MDINAAVRFGDDVLQDWKLIGRGGFGAVYRARQKDWRFHVAVKMLHTNDPPQQLWAEAENMRRACSPSVLRVFGVYRGTPPGGAADQRVGIIMEYMRRGTLESLLEALAGPPPGPLAFRLAHQLALGMNFLHSMDPPLLHRDLKPSNVLLDEDLNAKLADFGLSRVTDSVFKSRGQTPGDQAGTLHFTPPEAFQLSYQPVRSYDVYSYGILLWCILTGKKPYSGVCVPSLVALRVPFGDRPPCGEVDQSQAEGLGELVGLMQRCWDGDPGRRPSFGDCLEVTDCVFSRYKLASIRKSVDEVLSRMDSESSTRPNPQGAWQPPGLSAASSQAPPMNVAHCHPAMKENPHQKGHVYGFKSTKALSVKEKAAFVDQHRASLIQEVSAVMAITEDLGDMVHPETYSNILAEQANQDKLRLLYGVSLHSGGQRVKAAFYDGLVAHEPNLVERMGRKSPLPPANTTAIASGVPQDSDIYGSQPEKKERRCYVM